ncbi:NUDIX hydrolase [Paenibacillus oleatilyticus]|uniref:NUDIX hydrolase n=1 Tax=Paenibacillus oleatilyticus TaxID=2594886 RepID=A0ABV4UYF6_9BACL
MQKRRDNHCWAMHGGGVEIGETVEETAKRELLEETGLIANDLELLGVFSGEDRLYTYPNGDEVYTIGIVYVCRDFSGDLLSQTDETTELKWFNIDELPDDIFPPNKKPLKAFVDYINRTKGYRQHFKCFIRLALADYLSKFSLELKIMVLSL